LGRELEECDNVTPSSHEPSKSPMTSEREKKYHLYHVEWVIVCRTYDTRIRTHVVRNIIMHVQDYAQTHDACIDNAAARAREPN
jgi:hypothetical protein